MVEWCPLKYVLSETKIKLYILLSSMHIKLWKLLLTMWWVFACLQSAEQIILEEKDLRESLVNQLSYEGKEKVCCFNLTQFAISVFCTTM